MLITLCVINVISAAVNLICTVMLVREMKKK